MIQQKITEIAEILGWSVDFSEPQNGKTDVNFAKYTSSVSVSTGANTSPPKAISAETFASHHSMPPMDKSAIPSISLILVTRCPKSHTIGR